MTIKATTDFGGYVLQNGDIQVIFVDSDTGAKHGEQAHCPEQHTHDINCARAMLNALPVLQPARKDDDDKDIPAVLGKSMLTRATEWFASVAARPAPSPHITYPKKDMQVRNDQGKLVTKQVEDRDL